MTDDQPARRPFVFLTGLVLFLLSLAAFVADLVTGHGVLRSLAANAVGVGILIAWAAVDTLADPTSTVDSRGGAAGTGALLGGLYLVLAAAVVAATSPLHGRLELAAWAAALGVVLVAVGFLAFPSETVVGEGDDESTASEQASEDGTDTSAPRE